MALWVWLKNNEVPVCWRYRLQPWSPRAFRGYLSPAAAHARSAPRAARPGASCTSRNGLRQARRSPPDRLKTISSAANERHTSTPKDLSDWTALESCRKGNACVLATRLPTSFRPKVACPIVPPELHREEAVFVPGIASDATGGYQELRVWMDLRLAFLFAPWAILDYYFCPMGVKLMAPSLRQKEAAGIRSLVNMRSIATRSRIGNWTSHLSTLKPDLRGCPLPNGKEQ